MGATDQAGRIASSLAQAGPVEISFKQSMDTVNGGILFSLPALLAVGLLNHHSDAEFSLPAGYYRTNSIFLLLSFMALARLKSIESLRYSPPGEWGKILGLDRAPEVRTLRNKIALLAVHNKPASWSAALCKDWMSGAPLSAGALYVDGHVRVYHGSAAFLPRRYVAREKLCLRASVEYWVNAADGQPFFFAHKDTSSGLIDALQNDIVPRLLNDVPNQPTVDELQSNPFRHRFTVVFDREGYSPEFFLHLKEKRVACLTYHKFPKQDWPVEEFKTYNGRLVSGQILPMQLAERGTRLSKLWVREIRRMTQTGHQVSILATDFESDAVTLATRMFARWSQENFFKYMRENFALDRLFEHGVEAIPEAEKIQVVNPTYRSVDQAVRKLQGQLNRKYAEAGGLRMPPLVVGADEIEAYQEKKAAADEAILQLESEMVRLKADRKNTPKHVMLDQLPDSERFTRCPARSKHFLDTIKMVAYRAESAMAQILREKASTPGDERALLRALYRTEADLIPNVAEKTLTVRLHHLANRNSDAAIRHLCNELNETETIFPDTELRMVYDLVS